jgi:hypothetical protein
MRWDLLREIGKFDSNGERGNRGDRGVRGIDDIEGILIVLIGRGIWREEVEEVAEGRRIDFDRRELVRTS